MRRLRTSPLPWLAIAWMLAGGCALLRPQPQPASPVQVPGQLVLDQLVVHCDFDLPANHRLLSELTAQRDDISKLLELPVSDEPIHVYLFGTAGEFESFMAKRFPQLPRRRAFFVESDTELTVYAHWGERVAEDLRHEVAHGYLHAMVGHLPLWLDEGLAEYLEVPRGWRGLNRPHVELLIDELRREHWRPDLQRLETFRSAAEMTQRDYAESWAWVHLLLETTPERRALLRRYLAQLREDGTAPPLSRVFGSQESPADPLLATHLQVLDSRIPAALRR